MGDRLKDAMDLVHAQELLRASQHDNARLRQVISCAVCAHCSDEIADQDWDIDEAGRLVHQACVAESDRDNGPQGVGA